LDIDIVVGKIETEKKFSPKIGNIDLPTNDFTAKSGKTDL